MPGRISLHFVRNFKSETHRVVLPLAWFFCHGFPLLSAWNHNDWNMKNPVERDFLRSIDRL